ncbi:uncharacterized protein LOC115241718 isoform X2 [Formica exsecta]|uniref:uncharacterized protein LOC115241717 n=1 Tax=Formica exsecta TaxID=72781 RepID=UPI0011418954|nr:uncharacterized protein LOC115241717 [Formica exsecta]XP_029673487.1 uncharacterized protein LOC115241718 isoform X2 [Formica exsecta]
MRNLKKSYRNILDNNKKTSTGRGRINWEWYDLMEEIYREDRTVHIGPTISSMAINNNAVNEEHNSLTPSTSTCGDQNISSACSEMEFAEQITENEQSNRQQLVCYDSTSNDTSSQDNMKTKTQKAAKSKVMYDLRKKLLDCEEKRVEAINKLTETIEEHNKIQRERNDILRNLVSHAKQ